MTRPRIVSLLSSATEIVCGLGLEEMLVAISHECDFPPHIKSKPRATFSCIDSSQPSGQIDAQVKSRLAAGLPLYGIDEPLLRRLAPDLIITQAQCDVCAIRHDDVLRFVGSHSQLAGTKVLALNPTSLEDILLDVERVAEAAGAPQRGREVAGALRERIDRVAASTRLNDRERPRVVCIEWTNPLMAAGNWTPELIELADGQSGLAIRGEHSRYVSWEQIVEYDPQVLLIAPCGFDLPRSLREASQLPHLPGWNELAAVSAGHVYVLDGNALLNRSGPRMVDSLELIADLLNRAEGQSSMSQWEGKVARL